MTKNLLKGLVFSLFFSTAVKTSAQDLQSVYLWYDNGAPMEFTVPNGKLAEIVCGYGSIKISRQVDGIYDGRFGFLQLDARSQFPYYVCGPCKIENNDNAVLLTLRLKDNISTTTTTPTSAVVIPTDATGPVNVILESSTDLVTWTVANPGTYGASTTKRFFRVRAVNQ